MKQLNFLSIIIFVPIIYSCSAETPKSSEQNASPSSHVKMSTLASDSTSCTYGGVKIDMGIDDDMNGTLDASEVDKTEYVCNGDPGTAGDKGTTGDNGTAGADGIKPSSQIACDAALENTSLYFEYKATVFTDGSVLAHASIYGVAVEVTDSTFYDSSQNGASTGYINIRYDVSGTDNGGDWKISVNRSTLVTTVLYEDTDLSGGSLTWTLASSKCTTNSF